MVSNAVMQCCFGFIEAMLAPYAKKAAGMTQAEVGVAFFLMGLAYMITVFSIGQVIIDMNMVCTSFICVFVVQRLPTGLAAWPSWRSWPWPAT